MPDAWAFESNFVPARELGDQRTKENQQGD